MGSERPHLYSTGSGNTVFVEREHRDHAEIAALGFAGNPTAMTPETKSELTIYTLFTARPIDEEQRFNYVLRVETQYLRDHVLDKIAHLGRFDPDMSVSFYSQASRNPRFEVSMGYVVEKFVYAWLSSNPAERELVCRPADPEAVERIRLKPIGRDRLHIIAGKTRLKEAKESGDKLPFGWILASQSFPFIDAIICMDTLVITIQVATTSSHYADEKGFSQIKECLPDKTRNTRKWCHVFITDEEATADALRGAKYDVLNAMKISIHTAVLNIFGIRITPEDPRRWRIPEVCGLGPSTSLPLTQGLSGRVR
jgi:hypothetical protein